MRLYAVWIAAVLSEFLGGMDAILCPLIIFMIVEYSTGLLCCIVGKWRFSNRGVKAVFRKLTILCLVGIANTLEKKFFGTGSFIRTSIVLFYISSEGLSILENAVSMGVPVPKKLRRVIAQLPKRQR